jgi:hypothetical protein
MPNSTDALDRNFNAIEVAVKETARGRAFLADYARKVRQSDTLTMLALIRRLELWSEDQDIRLAQFEGRDAAFGNQRHQVLVGAAPELRGAPTEEMTGRKEVPPQPDHSGILTVTVCDQNSASVEQADAGSGKLDAPQNGEAIDRIENLANALRDLDRRLADLTNRHSSRGPFTDNGRSALVASTDDGVGVAISHSITSDAMNRAPYVADKTHPPEDDILDDIAKALGAVV